MILGVFIISVLYWMYLYFNTSMVIVFDAVGYEELGRLLLDQGWLAYFKTGPNREPLFSLFIALSMGLANIFQVSYQKIQLILQIILLAASQVLLWQLLVRLKVRVFIISAILLYWAFSPAIVNSAFSLYSEIVTYPCILLSIWFSLDLLTPVTKGSKASYHYLFSGMMWGIVALAFVMVKAVSLLMLWAMGLFIMGVLLLRWLKGQQRSRCVIMAVLIGLGMMHVGVTVFKSFNKHYNGNYTITNRAPFMLYGNVARRIEPHHKDNLKAAIALILGEGVCRSVANDKDCRYWQFMTADGLGTDRLIALNTTISAQQDIDAQLIRETKDMVIEHPLPVVFFGIVEGLKMFFWESTQIGFVVYPAWLTHIYENNIFKSCIRLIISVITGIVVIGFTVWSIRSKQSDKLLLVLMAWVFIFLLTWITVLPRYVFPIVPVYFLMAACWLNQLSVKAGKT